MLVAGPAFSQNYPSFDFTTAGDAAGWGATHDIGSLTVTSTGMLAQITGNDPYTVGPARNYPTNEPLWLRLKLWTTAGGSCQVFYFSNAPTEAASVRFSTTAGQWTEGRVALPGLGNNYRMRLDPPGTNGTATFAFLRFESRSDFPDFDLTTVPDVTGWKAQHDIASLTPTTNGLAITLAGSDPYLTGPARDYPPGKLLWLRMRLRSEQSGNAQVFYYQTGPTEANSVRFYVASGGWQDIVAPMPALGPGWSLRFDPPGSGGQCEVSRIWFEERVIYPPPSWPPPEVSAAATNAITLRSGDLEVRHNPDRLGAFRVSFAGKPLGSGNPQALAGYAIGNQVRWVPFGNSPTNLVIGRVLTNGFLLRTDFRDLDGGGWQVEQQFSSNVPNAIAVETRVTTDRDRQLLYLPAFTLLAGKDVYGTNKSQGLLAGLEYLENEPSSSELDVNGEAARRLVPDTKKITIPLMAVASNGVCLGLTWERQPDVTPVFDSPDRQFNSGAHLLGLLCPGSDGSNRDEGSLMPYAPRLLRSNQVLTVRCTILAGAGDTVIPAVQQYVRLHGLPPLPSTTLTAADYYRTAAHGWLDSEIFTNNLVRHAVWPGFNPQPAADAAVWMKWLAERAGDATLATRLSNAVGPVLSQVPGASSYNSYGVGHVRYPLPALIFGGVLENATLARSTAQNTLGRFESDGSVLYVAPSGGIDLGSTHYAPDANGLTAAVVKRLLENAVFAGDRPLIRAGLVHLRALAKFRNTVPRGAQTWEVPLHTPDILASADLVLCYLHGYRLTGETEMLEQARYWAWTGVPFVYLVPPVPADVGLYGTIPVFGATHWVGSWFGRPVQWCGLVYAEALRQLSEFDPEGPWEQLADGITASGTQQTWPVTDTPRQGLLPDFYLLQPQVSDGPAINPGTLQSQAVQFYTGLRPYSWRVLSEHGLFVQAPGSVGNVVESSTSACFTVTNWTAGAARVLVGGLSAKPGVTLNGLNTAIAGPHQYDAARGLLVLEVRGTSTIVLTVPALPRLDIKPAVTNAGVELSWPALGSNWALQTAADLNPPVAWESSAVEVRIVGDRLTVSEEPMTSQRFYRLRSVP
jgi:hypothetical protein